ncbi:MAG: H-NS histone family protein [Comamonadaceae bacterium]|nr:MAG: H-NS histone family protein [Comamonadaceae bacterium]
MTKTFAQITREIAALQAEAEKLRAQEVSVAIAEINERIARFDLAPSDLSFPKRGRNSRGRSGDSDRGRSNAGNSVPKYSDGSGNVWGGRGPRPLWLRTALKKRGSKLEDFLHGAKRPPAGPVAQAGTSSASKPSTHARANRRMAVKSPRAIESSSAASSRKPGTKRKADGVARTGSGGRASDGAKSTSAAGISPAVKPASTRKSSGAAAAAGSNSSGPATAE